MRAVTVTYGKINQGALKRRLGMLLIILSFAFYGILLLVPFAPFSAGRKVILSSILVVLGEASFWIAALILGKELIKNYKNIIQREKLKDAWRWLHRPGKGPQKRWFMNCRDPGRSAQQCTSYDKRENEKCKR